MANITVYSKPSCVQCTQTKKTLTKLGLPYVEVDVTEDQEAYDKIVALGFMAAPVVIAGERSWAGFKPDRLAALAVLAAA